MSDYVITCCSTADMAPEFFEERGIPYACFHFTMDGKEYPDDMGKSMALDEFYRRISAGAAPVTSQVNEEDYMKLFEPFLIQGKDVLHITLSSGISGTYNAASIAKQRLEEKYPERKVTLVDSLGASSGYGMLVTIAKDHQDAGMSYGENVEELEKIKLHIHHWFFSTDLSSYFRGGRISRTSAIFGTVLNICPLLNMNTEGKLIPRKKYRGKKRVMEEIVKRMEEHAEGGHNYSGKCYLSQSACYKDAREVADVIEERFPALRGKIIINNVGTVIGSHTGPGTVALFFLGDMREK